MRGAEIIGAELDEDSIRLQELRQAIKQTVVLLGHGHSGLPPEVWSYLDRVVEIPMLGVGRSLNVAVAGSLVLYKFAGLA
jgi:tRNA (guanosine-2'-O-)-methyltransferase